MIFQDVLQTRKFVKIMRLIFHHHTTFSQILYTWGKKKKGSNKTTTMPAEKKKRESYSCASPCRPMGLRDIEDPTLPLSVSEMAVRMSVLRAGRALPPEISSGTHF
jgi:hypothetical protein